MQQQLDLFAVFTALYSLLLSRAPWDMAELKSYGITLERSTNPQSAKLFVFKTVKLQHHVGQSTTRPD